jgi:nucleotide-binding universal stress UspA family protein
VKILLATDGSPDAEAALEAVRGLSLRPEDELWALTVVPAGAALGREAPAPQPDIEDTARAIAEDAVERLRSHAPAARPLVRHGVPSDRIIAAAEDLGVDLVVVGAKGAGGLRRFLLGSTSHRVARYAPCSVLVAKRPATQFRSVVVAADGSEAARSAVEAFAALPMPPGVGARVVCVTAAPRGYVAGPDPHSYAHLQPALDELREQAQAAARDMVEDAAGYLKEHGIAATWCVLEGMAVGGILAEVEARGADLVVAGSLSRSALKQLLLGSVALSLIKAAPCSVLIGRRGGRTG